MISRSNIDRLSLCIVHGALCIALLLLCSCREDVEIFIPEEVEVTLPEYTSVTGFYLLNEANMGFQLKKIMEDIWQLQKSMLSKQPYINQ